MAGIKVEAGIPVIDAANSGQVYPRATQPTGAGRHQLQERLLQSTGDGRIGKIPRRHKTRALLLLAGASRVPEAGEDPGATDGRELASYRALYSGGGAVRRRSVTGSGRHE